MRKISIGSISWGTLRPCDLITCFLSELVQYDSERASAFEKEIPEQAYDDEDHEYWSGDEADDMLSSLFDALGEFAPDYCYFGALSGDGSDFGFWPDWDAIEQGVSDGDILRVSDTGSVPEKYIGIVMQVSDHGNVEMYSYSDGVQSSLWSCV